MAAHAVSKSAAGSASRQWRRDTLIYAGAVAFDRALGLLLLPVLTRLLGPHQYGMWTQTGVAATLLMAITLYALPTVVVRHYTPETPVSALRRGFDQLGTACLGIAVLVLIALFSMPQLFARLLYGNADYYSLIPTLAVWACSEAMMEFSLAWWRARGLIDKVAFVHMMRSTLRMVLAISISAYARQNDTLPQVWMLVYACVMAGLALVVLLTSRAAVRRAHSSGRGTMPPHVWAQLREATPLSLLAIMTLIGGSADRYLLAAWAGLDTVAVYAAAVSLTAIPFMFHSVLGFTLFPAMSRHWTLGQHDEAGRLMALSLRVYVFLALPVALGMALVGHWALPLIATDKYQVSPMVFAGLAWSVLALGVQQILLYGLLLDGRGVQVLRMAAVSLGLNLILMVLWVPYAGINGAAAAAATANSLLVVLTVRVLKLALPCWQLPWWAMARVIMHALIAATPLYGVWVASFWSVPAVALALLTSGGAYLMLDWWTHESLLKRLNNNEY